MSCDKALNISIVAVVIFHYSSVVDLELKVRIGDPAGP